VVVVAAVAAATALLAAAAGRRGGGGAVPGGGGVWGVGIVGQVMVGVTVLATAAVQALFEQADFGLEVVDALVEDAVALTQARFKVGLLLGEALFELGFALGGAVVEDAIEADLLAGVAEGLVAGQQATRSLAGKFTQGVESAGVH
jgi:hypothetical protein